VNFGGAVVAITYGDRRSLSRQLDQEVHDNFACRERWRRSLTEIAAPPQLFIAA
jgi:hypothetical protein